MSENITSLLSSPALKNQKHICAIFDDSSEATEIIGKFVAEGCKRGHKTMFLLDPDLSQTALQDLGRQGVNVEEARGAGMFDLKVWKESYLSEDPFKCDFMLNFIETSMRTAHSDGHSCVWAFGDMNWAGKNPQTSAELIRYESRLNEMKSEFEDDLWVCFYDASQFNGKVISDIIRAHPVVLMGKRIHENPFYTPPAELLIELADWEKFRPNRSQAS